MEDIETCPWRNDLHTTTRVAQSIRVYIRSSITPRKRLVWFQLEWPKYTRSWRGDSDWAAEDTRDQAAISKLFNFNRLMAKVFRSRKWDVWLYICWIEHTPTKLSHLFSRARLSHAFWSEFSPALPEDEASLNHLQVALSPRFSSRHLHRDPIPHHSTLQIHDHLNPTRDQSRMHRYSRPGLGGRYPSTTPS